MRAGAETRRALAGSEEYVPLAEQLLSQPKPLYFFDPTANLPEETKAALQDIPLDVSMTVTRSGDARRVEILNPPAGLLEDDLEQIERQVREMTFRPALREGKIVSTEGFVWRYDLQAAAVDSP